MQIFIEARLPAMKFNPFIHKTMQSAVNIHVFTSHKHSNIYFINKLNESTTINAAAKY